MAYKVYKWETNPITNEKEYFTASNTYLLNNKIAKKKVIWRNQLEKHIIKLDKQLIKSQCDDFNNDLKQLNSDYDNLLLSTVDKNDKLEWKSLKDNSKFEIIMPILSNYYNPELVTMLFGLIPINKKKTQDKNNILKLNGEERLKIALNKWKSDKEQFDQLIRDQHKSIDEQEVKYISSNEDAVEFYHQAVFDNSEYPEGLVLNYNITFKSDSKIMIIDLDLPNKKELNQIASYKYIVKDNEINEVLLKEKQINDNYNSLIHKVIIRTLHETFESDYLNHIDLIVLNSWVNGIDPANGNDFRNCIASVQVTKKEFEEIKIDKIDPVACFKSLKGVSSGYFADLVPIKPIMKINTEDRRIIQADSVIDQYTSNQNLATMPWEDFEVLIRDLFSKEFSSETCKVEVTQASRDAGVDAIVFDEDPIKGGKYVIQAKRYNNVVSVSAVRDLYGTVMNEGAVKGILVTTSYFGSDSYTFAKGKPLTLISGGELIQMFNNHNYQVRINLKEEGYNVKIIK